MRRFLAFTVLAVLLAAATAAAATAKDPEDPGKAKKVKADRDGDKLFDDLEERLAELGEDDELGVIVTVREGVSAEELEAKVGEFDVTHRLSIVQGFAGKLSKRQVKELAALAEVAHVEENSEVHALNDSAQQSFGVTKARADAPALDGDGDGNPASYSPADFVTAVIDTGIDPSHQDLDGGKILAFKDFVNDRTTAYDDEGHGTHVAGTIAGDVFAGVAPAAALVGVKVLDRNGSGTMADVTAGIQWVVDNRATYGIEAINLSLGTSGCSDGTDATSAAVDAAHAAGIVVAVAAGNSGAGTCTIGSPGAAAGALTVGAMADLEQNGFKQAYFSSRGKTLDGRIKPDVSAPGVSIRSAQAGTASGYVVYSGTSMATPFVAGVAMLMLDANPVLTSQQVKDKVMQTAVDWGRGGDNKTAGTTGVDIDYGAGRLDAYAALASAGAPLVSPPPLPTHELKEGSLPGTGAVVDYQLEVTDTQFPIAATLIIPAISGGSARSPDFDLYLFDPSGTQVASAYTTRRQDELGYKPAATGTYTLRVKSYSGSGDYFVDVSAGLGTPAPPPPPPADTTAPTVTAVSPADGATGVLPGANVSVSFSEAMDKASAEGAFSLNAGGTPVTGTFTWSDDTLTFDPAGDLAKGAQYTATVTTAAKDAAGNALAADTSWTFTVASVVTITAFPTSVSVLTGTYKSGSAASLAADDGSYYVVRSTTSGTRLTAWAGTVAGVSNDLANLRVTYRGKNSRTCTQTISIYRWTDATWVALDTRSVGGSELEIGNLAPGGTVADYVSGTAGDGDLAIRVSCSGGTKTFDASGELLKIVYDE